MSQKKRQQISLKELLIGYPKRGETEISVEYAVGKEFGAEEEEATKDEVRECPKSRGW